MRWACVMGLIVTTIGAAYGSGAGETPVSDTRSYGASAAVFDLRVTPGAEHLHRFPILGFIHKNNPPQMAAWVESPSGDYLATLFVTERVATQSWRRAPGDVPADEIRRPEALPVWTHRRGQFAEDGNPLPTRDLPMPDAVTLATPTEEFDLNATFDTGTDRQVVVFLEVNHSLDFNAVYRPDLDTNDPHYNGGEWGSGQPSLVYAATVDLSETDTIKLRLVGHGSPSGSDGDIRSELLSVDTARSIVDRATVSVRRAAAGDR